MRNLVIAVGVMAAAAPAAAQGRPCKIEIISAEHNFVSNQVIPGNTNYDLGGNVHLRCVGQQVFLDTDSLSIKSGQYIQLFGHAVYRDTAYRFSADSMTYLTSTEKLEARHDVHVLDLASGSTLVGPYVDYWRAVKGVNDSARVDAIQRPTVRYFTRAGPVADTAGRKPYVLVGDRLHGFGQSRLWGGGAVAIDRDSVHGTGDSLAVVREKTSVANLIGKPATLRRNGTDSFTVLGREIRLGLDGDSLRDLRAFLDAKVIRGESRVAGDTVHLGFEHGKLALTLAWARGAGATLHSEGYDVRGDSLAVESPGELLREVRVFRHGVIQNPRDSVVAIHPAPSDSTGPDVSRNTLWGEHLVARFAQVDSAGTIVTRLRELQSFGKAASLFSRTVQKGGKPSPSTNYTRADTIIVVMRGGDSTGVALVHAVGHVDGLQQETASLRKPAADSGRPPAGVVRP